MYPGSEDLLTEQLQACETEELMMTPWCSSQAPGKMELVLLIQGRHGRSRTRRSRSGAQFEECVRLCLKSSRGTIPFGVHISVQSLSLASGVALAPS